MKYIKHKEIKTAMIKRWEINIPSFDLFSLSSLSKIFKAINFTLSVIKT